VANRQPVQTQVWSDGEKFSAARRGPFQALAWRVCEQYRVKRREPVRTQVWRDGKKFRPTRRGPFQALAWRVWEN